MYSVIHPIEVLDDNDEMVSTWLIRTTGLQSIETGNQFITDNIDHDLVEFTWVVETSDLFRLPFNSEYLCFHENWDGDAVAMLETLKQNHEKLAAVDLTTEDGV